MININSCVKVKDPGLLSSGYLWGPLLSVQWPWPIAPVHTAHTNKKSWWIREWQYQIREDCVDQRNIFISCITPWKTERWAQIYKYLLQIGKNTVSMRGFLLSLLIELFHKFSRISTLDLQVRRGEGIVYVHASRAEDAGDRALSRSAGLGHWQSEIAISHRDNIDSWLAKVKGTHSRKLTRVDCM